MDEKNENSQLDEHQKQKRRRLNPTHRWTDTQVAEMLHIIAAQVRENVESFEKPTVQSFYNKVCAQSPLLQHLNWLVMKGKMRHLKASYINAMTWRSKTGAGLLANGEEKTVGEYIRKMCPHWNVLSDIFGQRKSVAPSFIYESTSVGADESLADIQCSDLFEVVSDEDDGSATTTSTPEVSFVESKSAGEIDLTDEPSTSQQRRKGCVDLKKNLPRKSSSPFDLLVKMQERRLDLETKKIEMEAEASKNNLQQQLLIKKLEFEKEERIAVLKLEKELELKKYELELKFKNNLL